MLGERNELSGGGIEREDFPGLDLVDPRVQVQIAFDQPRSDGRERPQILELNQDVFFDRSRDEQVAIESALRMAKRGDLVLVFGDKPSRCWKQIIYFKPDEAEDAPRTPTPPPPRPSATPGMLDGLDALTHGNLIQDERGVRLARETDD